MSTVMSERTGNEAGMLRATKTAGMAVAVVVAAVAIMTGARAWLGTATTAGGANQPQPAPAAMVGQPPQQQGVPADVALTVLETSGFAPSEIGHAAGHFRIVVQNHSGVGALDLRIDGEAQSRFAESHVLGEVQGWIAPVELAAGTYTITEANHPAWVCRLAIQ